MTTPNILFPTLTGCLEALEVGEKYELPVEHKISARRIATRLQEKHGRRYVCRSIPDGSYQVWRTA